MVVYLLLFQIIQVHVLLVVVLTISVITFPSVLYFNARSVKNKIPEVQVRVIQEDYNIVAITESWLDDSYLDCEIFPSNYHVFRNDRNSHGGGVLLAVKDVLCPIDKHEFDIKDHEIIWVEFKSPKGRVLIGVFYRPPNYPRNYMDSLDDYLVKIHSSKNSFCFIALLGDFNIHMEWVDGEPVNIKGALPSSLIDCMDSCGLSQVLNEPSYVTHNGNEHFFDLVFVSNPLYVNSCETSFNVNDKCDHKVIVLNLDLCKVKTKDIDKPVYCLNRANFNQMRCIISNSPWNVCNLIEDVSKNWDFIEYNINAAIEKSVPKKYVKKGRSVPWMTKDIKKLCTKKKRLYKKFKKSGCQVAEKQFKECSNNLKKTIRKRHSVYSLNISKTAGINPKKFWNYVRSNTKDSSQLSFTTDDGDLTDPQDIACAFNKHFSSNFGTSSHVDLNCLPDSPPSHGGACFSFDSFSVDEVYDVIHKLNTRKSPGPDGILPVFLKSCANELAPVICNFFNKSISTGEIPSAWKCANVVPIYKGSGKPKDAISSYRPVSLTAILCKALERLVCKHLLDYLNEFNILSDNQFGFRHGRSCEQMLAKFYHFLSGKLDNSRDCNLIDGIFPDFSAAFDRVDHCILLQKLHNYGIRGNLLRWIRSFLSERKQRVVFRGSYSGWTPVTSGVPQGSVLGPILFLLFVNDINDSLTSPLFQFADDHTIVRCIIRSVEDHKVYSKIWIKFIYGLFKIICLLMPPSVLLFIFQGLGSIVCLITI